MNDKQKKFIDQVHRLGEWQHRELYERVEQLLLDSALTVRELRECLDTAEVKGEAVVFDEIEHQTQVNEESALYIENLQDDDVIKHREPKE